MQDEIMRQAEQYAGRSEAELFDALRGMTDEARASGDMNDSKLEEIYRLLYPMLSEQQRAKMQEVLARLRG